MIQLMLQTDSQEAFSLYGNLLPFQVYPEYQLLFPYITLAVEIFDTLFIAALAISIYLFKVAWEEPR
jgi:hypothetical protein